MSPGLTWLAVFLAVAISDGLWTGYIRAVTMARPLRAAVFSALLVAAGAVVTVSVVGDHLTVIPASLGAFVGTYLVARRG